MMYSDKFVVAIKSGGKVLRETKDLVHLPFGSEFSVLVKNLNSRRAKFTLHIDGQDVLDGTEIIVNANSEVELKRFIRNGNMNEGNAFKFIERTKQIEDGPRGIKVDDGVVRVEFWFEQEQPIISTTIHHHKDIWWNDYYRYPRYHPTYPSIWSSVAGNIGSEEPLIARKGVIRGMGIANATFSATSTTASSLSADAVPLNAPTDIPTSVDMPGITVPGSKIEQKFQTVYGFKPENVSRVIILRLVGVVGTKEVKQAVTVKSKQKCTTCGHINKATARFCADCGTALELV